MNSSLKKNFILQVLYQILVIITPLLTAPYIARVLGAKNVGINSYTFAIISYFVMFAQLGIANYGSRLISQKRNSQELLDEAFSELFLIHLIVAIFVYLVFLAFLILFVNDHKLVFLLQSIYLFGQVFDISWLYFGLEEFKKIVTKNSVIKILNVLAIFMLVRKESDLPYYVAIISIGTFLNYIVLWFSLNKYVSFKKVTIKQSSVHLKPLIVLFLPAIAVMLYKYMDKIMLMNLKDSASVGHYDSGEKIIVLCLGLINALGVVMLPRISNLKGMGDTEKVESYFSKSLLGIGFISIGCCFGAFGIAKDFVPLFFGEGYEPSIDVMRLLAITLPFSAFANVVKTQFTLPSNKDSFFARTLICGAMLNFVINFCLIPRFGVIGASIGTICTEVFVCGVQMFASNKEMNTFRKMAANIGFVLIGFIMLLGLNIFDCINTVLVRIVIKVLFGALVYSSLSVVYLLIIDKNTVLSLFKSFKRGK